MDRLNFLSNHPLQKKKLWLQRGISHFISIRLNQGFITVFVVVYIASKYYLKCDLCVFLPCGDRTYSLVTIRNMLLPSAVKTRCCNWNQVNSNWTHNMAIVPLYNSRIVSFHNTFKSSNMSQKKKKNQRLKILQINSPKNENIRVISNPAERL